MFIEVAGYVINAKKIVYVEPPESLDNDKYGFRVVFDRDKFFRIVRDNMSTIEIDYDYLVSCLGGVK